MRANMQIHRTKVQRGLSFARVVDGNRCPPNSLSMPLFVCPAPWHLVVGIGGRGDGGSRDVK